MLENLSNFFIFSIWILISILIISIFINKEISKRVAKIKAMIILLSSISIILETSMLFYFSLNIAIVITMDLISVIIILLSTISLRKSCFAKEI